MVNHPQSNWRWIGFEAIIFGVVDKRGRLDFLIRNKPTKSNIDISVHNKGLKWHTSTQWYTDSSASSYQVRILKKSCNEKEWATEFSINSLITVHRKVWSTQLLYSKVIFWGHFRFFAQGNLYFLSFDIFPIVINT